MYLLHSRKWENFYTDSGYVDGGAIYIGDSKDKGRETLEISFDNTNITWVNISTLTFFHANKNRYAITASTYNIPVY